MPDVVMLLRHAEKELGGVPPFGVASDGSRDPQSLTVRGWQRAGALVGLFNPGSVATESGHLPSPTSLFASRIGETNNRSRRPRETLEPLSARLGIAIDERFLKAQIPELVTAIEAVQGVVLVAWEHKMIPPLAAALLGGTGAVPQLWPDDRFDLIWILERDATGTSYRFRQQPELLLAGDGDQPI